MDPPLAPLTLPAVDGDWPGWVNERCPTGLRDAGHAVAALGEGAARMLEDALRSVRRAGVDRAFTAWLETVPEEAR